MQVITKTRDMIKYIFLITDNAPKKYRFTLVSRLQNYSLSVLEDEIKANEAYGGTEQMRQFRVEYQKKAVTDCRLLEMIALIAFEQKCITPKQYEQISKFITEILKLLYGWMKVKYD